MKFGKTKANKPATTGSSNKETNMSQNLNNTYDYSVQHDGTDDDTDASGTVDTLPGGAQTTGESSFSSVARKEWIHAVFGKSLQQPKGKGLAQIDEYLCTRILRTHCICNAFKYVQIPFSFFMLKW